MVVLSPYVGRSSLGHVMFSETTDRVRLGIRIRCMSLSPDLRRRFWRLKLLSGKGQIETRSRWGL